MADSFLALLFLLFFGCASNEKIAPTGNGIQFFDSDLKNFWEAYELAKKNEFRDCPKIFRRHYQDKASIGLRDFYELRINSNERLCETVQVYSTYYDYFQKNPTDLNEFSSQIKKAYFKLKELYPHTTPVDIYYLIGRTSSAGTIKDNRNLIGLEMFVGGDEQIDLKIIPKHIKVYRLGFAKFPELVIHEVIHTQQKYPDMNILLEGSIGEGAADFVTELAIGTHPNKAIYEYGYKNEKKIWRQFKKKMYGKDFSDFLYNPDSSENPDLGYFIGYRIVEAYYQKSKDKKQAIFDILNINDFRQFYLKSGYNP